MKINVTVGNPLAVADQGSAWNYCQLNGVDLWRAANNQGPSPNAYNNDITVFVGDVLLFHSHADGARPNGVIGKIQEI